MTSLRGLFSGAIDVRVLVAHLLRGIDDTRVVAELQRSDHSCPNGQHQRKGQLLLREQYKRVQQDIFSNTMERTESP